MLRSDRGLGRLELLGAAVVIFSALAFIDPLRTWVGDTYNQYIWSNTFWSGVLITVVSLVTFAGSTYLLLYTNLGARLGFLIAGAGLTGWGAINGLLFVLTVPRGPRPAEFEGLNAFQLRIMSLAMMIGSAILFAMFLTALNRLEQADAEG
ncbi:MAG: sugar transferase [Acidimicrobiia bacterium]|nr:sugar transferase [Acidimicrobiia bacterium]